jgi:hypothetical protein
VLKGLLALPEALPLNTALPTLPLNAQLAR